MITFSGFYFKHYWKYDLKKGLVLLCYACNKPTCIGDQYIKLAKLVFWSVSQTLATKQVRVLNITLKWGKQWFYKELQNVCKFNVVNLLNSRHENMYLSCKIRPQVTNSLSYYMFTHIEIIALPIWILNRNSIQQNGKEIQNFIFHLLCHRKYVYELWFFHTFRFACSLDSVNFLFTKKLSAQIFVCIVSRYLCI